MFVYLNPIQWIAFECVPWINSIAQRLCYMIALKNLKNPRSSKMLLSPWEQGWDLVQLTNSRELTPCTDWVWFSLTTGYPRVFIVILYRLWLGLKIIVVYFEDCNYRINHLRVVCMCRIKINCLTPNTWFEREFLCLKKFSKEPGTPAYKLYRNLLLDHENMGTFWLFFGKNTTRKARIEV